MSLHYFFVLYINNILFIYQTKIDNPPQKNSKSGNAASIGLEQRLARKHLLIQSNKLRGRNHENFIQLRRTIEDTIGLQFDPAGNIINLSTKTFNRVVFKLLNKNLNFVLTQKYFNKKKDFLTK